MTTDIYTLTLQGVRPIMWGICPQWAAAYRQAKECPLPVTLRPANADDIVAGAVIWYPQGDEGHFWKIVSEPRFYGDAFKAYVADDGSRYGLDGAYVEVTA